MGSIRFGLCCQFLDAPIRLPHRHPSLRLDPDPGPAADYLRQIAADNAAALSAAVTACRSLGIGAFRINSQILPLGTHPRSGYTLERLDPSGAIAEAFRRAGEAARTEDVRLSFHPDQFVVLNSERPEVVDSAIEELEFQTGDRRAGGGEHHRVPRRQRGGWGRARPRAIDSRTRPPEPAGAKPRCAGER